MFLSTFQTRGHSEKVSHNKLPLYIILWRYITPYHVKFNVETGSSELSVCFCWQHGKLKESPGPTQTLIKMNMYVRGHSFHTVWTALYSSNQFCFQGLVLYALLLTDFCPVLQSVIDTFVWSREYYFYTISSVSCVIVNLFTCELYWSFLFVPYLCVVFLSWACITECLILQMCGLWFVFERFMQVFVY